MEEPEPGGQEDVKDFGEMNAIGGVLHIKTTTGEERFLDVDIVNDTASVFGYDLKWQAIRRSWTRWKRFKHRPEIVSSKARFLCASTGLERWVGTKEIWIVTVKKSLTDVDRKLKKVTQSGNIKAIEAATTEQKTLKDRLTELSKFNRSVEWDQVDLKPYVLQSVKFTKKRILVQWMQDVPSSVVTTIEEVRLPFETRNRRE
jgi:hypothetical protein